MWAGASAGDLKQVAGGAVNISAPYSAAGAEAVAVKVGNVTDVSVDGTLKARYVKVGITGSYLGDGRGGTLAEFAVI